ncbi:family 43 glycosylhydrolase [Pontiella sp. NLcol2]|uniref:Family 43 glycosylhydrolase n=2 Tax=Pontiella agarivorans TaxID=3038953 RepID=A0ABU5MUG2_9BACT|nr:family 43 glycosylhydrolase [Pontiella agarivorans]
MKKGCMIYGLLAVLIVPIPGNAAEQQSFPYKLPMEKPDIPLSEAMERVYDDYASPTYWWNELFSKFRYTPIEGLDYSNHDGTVTRRDPSKVIKHAGRYYVWYTCRKTEVPPQGAQGGSETLPSFDWDMSEIWYATSEDGFTWKEQGVAVRRPPKPAPGWRSVSTPDILVWKGTYYLYYQAFQEMPGKRGDDCPVAVSWADSPDGPWTPLNRTVIPNGPAGAWDQYSIHDPYPLVYRGRIYLYYKSDFNGRPELIRAQGLATADHPLGPFEKCPLNPVLNSGHETAYFPFKGGIAALAGRHGNEMESIQWSPDGINFREEANSTLLPVAAGPYVPDAFTDSGDGRGITWGLCHFTQVGGQGRMHSMLGRFDCDLSLDYHDPQMKDPSHNWPPEVYFRDGLSEGAKERLRELAIEDLAQEDAVPEHPENKELVRD